MKEQKYRVCKGKRLTGRKRVMSGGQIFSIIDFIGDIDTAIKNGLCEEVKEKEIEVEESQEEKNYARIRNERAKEKTKEVKE